MKFKEAHRIDILSCLSSQGFSKDQYSFKKKKGRIIIAFNNDSKWFSYFYKEEYYFDPKSMKKIDTGFWEVISESTELQKVAGWQIVLGHLKAWAKTYKS